jgi:hypothetical protein
VASVPDLAAELTRDAADRLARAIRAMPPDKVAWSPFENGRTAIDQVVECAGLNMIVADILTRRDTRPLDEAAYERMRQENDTAEKALALLERGTAALVRAIEGFPHAHLDDTLVLPFAGNVKRTFARMMMGGYWNMIYHWGQINYIQTLYGDREDH